MNLLQEDAIALLEGVERLRRQHRKALAQGRQPGPRAGLVIEQGVVQIEEDGPHAGLTGRLAQPSNQIAGELRAHEADGTRPTLPSFRTCAAPVTGGTIEPSK